MSDGVVTAFIPDPVEKAKGTSAAEGVAADVMGSIYGAEVGPKRVMKYNTSNDSPDLAEMAAHAPTKIVAQQKRRSWHCTPLMPPR